MKVDNDSLLESAKQFILNELWMPDNLGERRAKNSFEVLTYLPERQTLIEMNEIDFSLTD